MIVPASPSESDLTNGRMPIQDVQLLVAQARVEADDPLLKVIIESR